MSAAAKPLVLVLTQSETFGLRLRLMLEQDGAEVIVAARMADCVPADMGAPRLVVTDGLVASPAHIPTLVVEAGTSDDWELVRRRLSMVLVAGGGEAGWLAAALAQSRILVVDDSQTYREYLRLELSRMGALVTVCGSVAEALAALGRQSWDCLIVDLILPGADGVQLCAQLASQRRRAGAYYLLVVMSSRESKDDMIRSLQAGADAFIGKSQDLAVIRARLGAALRHRMLAR